MPRSLCALILILTSATLVVASGLEGQLLQSASPSGASLLVGPEWPGFRIVVEPEGMPHKSLALAGVLSAYVPGLGSFYAGDPGHGVRHLLAVPLGGGLLFVLGSSMGDAGAVFGIAGLAVLLGNWPWAVVTAVRDAQEFNRNAGSAPPETWADGTTWLPARIRPLKIELVRIAF